jgi:hypothetical protein
MSLKEAERTFLAYGRSLDDTWYIVIPSTILMRDFFARNQVSSCPEKLT